MKWEGQRALQELALFSGMGLGVVINVKEVIEALPELPDAINAILNNPTILKELPESYVQNLKLRLDKFEKAYETAEISGVTAAGAELGQLLNETIGILAGGYGVAKGGVSVGKNISNIVSKVNKKLPGNVKSVSNEKKIGGQRVNGASTSNFFKGAKYSTKVMKQMGKADDIAHAFPKSVDAFAAKYGQWSTRVGSDGKTYQWLTMKGSYGGKKGTFEFIKDADGVINHRYFNVVK